jgi:hypothetical protein
MPCPTHHIDYARLDDPEGGSGDVPDEACVERRLAAILAGDVVGYSRLMGVDGLSSGMLAFRVAIPRCMETAHVTASTTLGNSMRMPSPVVFTTRP